MPPETTVNLAKSARTDFHVKYKSNDEIAHI